MTMPHLMNCQHSESRWCLSCAKQFVELKASPFRELKPLEWEYPLASIIGGKAYLLCHSPLKDQWYYVCQRMNNQWQYRLPHDDWTDCDSEEDGKRVCWEHYQRVVAELFVGTSETKEETQRRILSGVEFGDEAAKVVAKKM